MPEENTSFFTIKKTIIYICLGVLIHYFFIYEDEVNYGPGVLITETPKQDKIKKSAFIKNEFKLTKIYKYSLNAKILSKEDYNDKLKISPTDLALGWNNMSDKIVTDSLNISQSGRWYRYYWTKYLPLTKSEITKSSANTHIIPANEDVEYTLKKIRKGNLIHLEGFLVNIDKGDYYWRTSTKRTDTGNGACEIVYTERLEILEPNLEY